MYFYTPWKSCRLALRDSNDVGSLFHHKTDLCHSHPVKIYTVQGAEPALEALLSSWSSSQSQHRRLGIYTTATTTKAVATTKFIHSQNILNTSTPVGLEWKNLNARCVLASWRDLCKASVSADSSTRTYVHII